MLCRTLAVLVCIFVLDAIKQEEAAAEKRYFDGLIHDGIQCSSYIVH